MNQAVQTTIRDQSQPDDELAATYLLQLQDLASEISRAMESIATNALASFQESVARQEMLCHMIAGIANTIRGKVWSPEQRLVVSDRFLEARIHDTSESIRRLNLQYAALLHHSGRSIAMLTSLCQTHTGQYQEARGPRLKRQTWSCEM
jgi:predicted transcriptional regulator